MRLLLLFLLLGCAHRPHRTPASFISGLGDSVVQVIATVVIRSGDTTSTQTWTGSGVVYESKNGRSRILTANHVLDVPGPARLTIKTADNRTCALVVLKLGVSDHRDVATAEADCDAGPSAKLAPASPLKGAKVYVVGHPLGVRPAVTTAGYVAGWLDGYLLTSAPAASGNSGGPVYNSRGEVVGLLVRGSDEYPVLTLAAPLSELQARIAESE